MLNRDLISFTHLLCSKGMRALINLLYMSLLARALGPNGMGEWAMVIGASTLLHSLLLSWMHPPTVRFGREEWSLAGSLAVTWASRWPFLLLGLLCVGALLLLVPLQWLTHLFHLSNDLTSVVFISMLGFWLSSETQNMLQVRGEFSKVGYLSVSIGLVSIMVLAFLRLDIVAITGAYEIILVLQGLNTLLWFGALEKIWRESNFRWQWPVTVHLKRNMVYAWPLIPGFFLGFVSDWGDQLIIRYFFTSREVGLFQTAYQVMLMLLGSSALISSVLLPRLIDRNYVSPKGARDFMVKVGPTTIALGLYLLMPTITVIPYLFSYLFGTQFLGATNVFIVLCMVIPGSLLSSFYGIFFNIQGRFLHSTVFLGGVKIAVNLALSFSLVPVIGIMGSAIATAASYAVLQYLYYYDQHRFYGISLTKINVVFFLMCIFSVAQAMVGMEYLPRAIVCFVGLALLTVVARKYYVFDRDTILTLFSGSLTGLGSQISKVVVSDPRHAHKSNGR